MACAYIGLGANLCDPQRALAQALRDLAGTSGIRIVAVAPLYLSRPVGGPAQPPFLNSAAALQTALSPQVLLARMQAAELAAGRVRGERWGPRMLDLDLLLHGESVIDLPQLAVPHPRMHERRFVLVPLAVIAGPVIHPRLQRSIADLLAALPAVPGDVVQVAGDWPGAGLPGPAA